MNMARTPTLFALTTLLAAGCATPDDIQAWPTPVAATSHGLGLLPGEPVVEPPEGPTDPDDTYIIINGSI